jgi:L-threonylcarbamoyladenylate synthase
MDTPDGSKPRSGTKVRHAARLLRHGGLVAVPTETVYGLAADAGDPEAVNRIFSTKGRPADHPLIVHVLSRRQARRWAAEWPRSAEVLSRRFWPGPLTIIVRRSRHALDAVTGGRDTVAVRVPAHPVMRRLLRRVRRGLAAPSANRFGDVSPTRAEHVVNDLGDAVDYVLDGGPCDVGLESTIVDCTVDPPQILRPGAVTEEMIDSVLGRTAAPQGPSRAPGMMERHYSPRCRVIPLESRVDAEIWCREHPGTTTRILDPANDVDRFATDLYRLLRLCDDEAIEAAVVVLPSDRGIGSAIRDRVRKAAAGRPDVSR